MAEESIIWSTPLIKPISTNTITLQYKDREKN